MRLLTLLALTVAGAASAVHPGTAGSIAGRDQPRMTLIHGVPFVSWHAAARLHYRGSDDDNPSIAASLWMLRGYWAGQLEAPESIQRYVEALASDEGGDAATVVENATIDDIKQSIAGGIPVMVVMPFTRAGHPVSPELEMILSMSKMLGEMPAVPLRDGPRSNLLGRMVALGDVAVWQEAMKISPVTNEQSVAARVIVGYDDERAVFVVHDPSFGPAWEPGYADFARMWAASEQNIFLLKPDNAATVVEERRGAPAYRARTADEQAAECYVLGYTLSATGRLAEGEQQFRQGLALTSIQNGYRHLLGFDLALTLGEMNRIEDAIAAARDAASLVPDNPGPWSFLAQLYTLSKQPNAKKLSGDAAARARKLEADADTARRVAAALPSDFWIPAVARARGWGADSIRTN